MTDDLRTSKTLRAWVAAALAGLLLAACGGGGDAEVPGSGSTAGAPTTKGSFTAVVAFGDSLSDVGTYTPATQVPGTNPAVYFGGKFTTNDGSNGTVWVENLATRLGLAVLPAVMGFAGQSQACPAALVNPAYAAFCTGYAQGGSRVSDPNGIGHTTSSGAPAALTVPVTTQVANHLAKAGTFSANELVLVWAGNNDVFVQFSAFGTTAAQIQAAAATGSISADEANRQLFAAQTAAQEAVKSAAQTLADTIKSQILAKGAKYVAVLNLPDSAKTPMGLSPQVAPAASVLTTLVDTFNLWLRDGLTGQPVQIVDVNTVFAAVAAGPSPYGIANVTVPACDATKIAAITQNQVTDGSSLFCNATAGAPYNGIRTGADVSTWFFADGVHPTTGGHKIISDYVASQLAAFGWI